MLQKTITATKILAAPAIYIAGRVVKNAAMSARSATVDPDYIRGYVSKLQHQHRSSDLFMRFVQAAKLCAAAQTDIDEQVLELFPKSNGQLLQDIVAALVHKGRAGGYFVEIGVGDGIKYSNTLLLERDFAWSGILAEPATMFHDAITIARRARLDKRAVSNTNGEKLAFEQVDSFGELSGLARQRSPRGKQSLTTYEVETVRLDDLLDEHHAPDEIQYVSIDTEGSELNVLKGLSFDKRRVWFFTIEHNFDRQRLKAYDSILDGRGYRRILSGLSSFDAWYVHQDLTTPF